MEGNGKKQTESERIKKKQKETEGNGTKRNETNRSRKNKKTQ